MLSRKFDVATYQKEKKGQTHCGDSYFYIELENMFICAIADGLGSGEFAKESSEVVICIIKENYDASDETIMEKCNKQLADKRGVVLGILKINTDAERYTFSSIGNIGLMTVTKEKKKNRNIPKPGYLAGRPQALKVMQGKLESNMSFILFSDGLSESEIANCYFFHADVSQIVNNFKSINNQPRDDDTTLIAIKYIK